MNAYTQRVNDMIDLIATNNFRWVKREVQRDPTDAVGEVRQVLQQRVKVTESAGTSKERSYYAWLDVDGPAFEDAETPEQAAAREHLEDEALKGGVARRVRVRLGN